jgi:hypothetical protein
MFWYWLKALAMLETEEEAENEFIFQLFLENKGIFLSSI